MNYINFSEAMCVFIAECMVIASKGLDKASAIMAMASMANLTFKKFLSTPEAVAEVKEVILSFS